MQCLNCGKSLEGNKIYCDDVCQYDFYGKNGGKAPTWHRICKHCGKPFDTNRFHQIYCCTDCQKNAYEAARPSREMIRRQNAIRQKAYRQYYQLIRNFDNSSVGVPEKPSILCEESALDKTIREADECGLSYGMYRAQLKLGKTYEDLKADYESRRNLD